MASTWCIANHPSISSRATSSPATRIDSMANLSVPDDAMVNRDGDDSYHRSP
jgi:hypothetical protein